MYDDKLLVYGGMSNGVLDYLETSKATDLMSNYNPALDLLTILVVRTRPSTRDGGKDERSELLPKVARARGGRKVMCSMMALHGFLQESRRRSGLERREDYAESYRWIRPRLTWVVYLCRL